MKSLLKPVKVIDPVLGTFKLDRRMNWYEAKYSWNSRKILLWLSRDECQDENELFDLAKMLCKAQRKWERLIVDYAVKKLLKLKNESWLDEGEKPLSAQLFKKRMKLETILVSPGGQFRFGYDDGDLFWGHTIVVCGSLSEGPTDANIEG